MNLVIVGDSLLDRDVQGSATRLSPDAPVPVLDEHVTTSRPGGAGLAAVLAAADGHLVTLITALARDPAADEVRAGLAASGVELIDLGLEGHTPEKIRFFAGAQPLLRLDRAGGLSGVVAAHGVSAAARAAMGWAHALLVSDYGRGVTAQPGVRAALAESAARLPVVWDPHPRGAAPVPGVLVATPNEREAAGLVAEPSGDDVARTAEALRRRWELEAVCVTRGAEGALLAANGSAPLAVPSPVVAGGDPCGAGDRFASGLAGALGQGASMAEATREAVAVSAAFVAAGGARGASAARATTGAVARGQDGDAVALAQRVRASGGTVVATGGCFDLLHAGHISTLVAARTLGDCLIVCLNSDASVRRLKGSSRPLVSEQDRVCVLEALAPVDGVVIFDEDSPEAVLCRLRPHLWVKGGDYQGVRLPEADVLAQWGGRALVLPYVEGHSTTKLIQEAATNV